ncbi:cytochrome c [Paraglaciecola aquimarina]|uniref:Cytochrome c n=1 Tax=Paraglaciecola algarum TaxID=3050085 RepID=A0ABS9DA14_9ALTE|nr:cytochrome c [Paraglaciecola sp. G1-23]MCF2949579.1 cytochrome c [Paraglaciecola sp. G1-23]
MNLFIKQLLPKLLKGLCICLVLQSSAALSEVTSEGQTLYESTCVACHGKKLEGGAGFNLRDETWVHGDSPSQIKANIKKGFSNAGMPAFGAIYNDAQISNIVDYILSKREGLSNLSYQIYHIDNNGLKSFDIIKNLQVKKAGKLPNNLMDFQLPEVNNYIIEFEGDLYAPKDQASHLFGMAHRELFKIEIDGKVVKPTSTEWMKLTWPLKRGKQHFKMSYSTAGDVDYTNRAMGFFVSNNELTQKLFAVSLPGKQFLNKATINIKAQSQPLVERKKVVNLPTSSVSVGFPEKINYAFNTKSCSIVGVWTEDLLNVGPNVEGRGKDGSLILGDWVFHSEQGISPVYSAPGSCTFTKYNRVGNPTFTYQVNGRDFSVQVAAISAQSLLLTYTLLSGEDTPLKLDLPKLENGVFTSQDGQITNNKFSTQAKVAKAYHITLNLTGSAQ